MRPELQRSMISGDLTHQSPPSRAATGYEWHFYNQLRVSG